MAKRDRLRELVAINRAIASSLDYEEVLRRLVEQTAAFIEADACALLLVNGDDRATVRASVGVDGDAARHFQAPVDDPNSADLHRLLGARCEDTFLGVPVVSHGRLVGLLAVCRRGPKPPRPDEEFLLSALADQAAIALEHAGHYQRVRQDQQRGQEVLRIIAARARCILWYADVVDRGDGTLYWDLKVFDEESAQRFFPIRIPPGLSYVQAWYESRLPEDKRRMSEYGDAEARAGRSYRQEFRCRRLDGEIRWLAEDVQIETLGPDRWRAVGVCIDITDRKRAEQRLATQDTVTRVLAESATLNDAASKILRVICEYLGWEVGALWYVDREYQVLRCSEVHHLPSVLVPRFEAISRQRTFEPGIGLPGRVWATGKAAWIPDVVRDANFPRAPIAAAEGLHGAFGFPIMLDGDVQGVIEFFSHEIREPDEDLLQMMTAIGCQIGQFMERKRAEEALRGSKEGIERQWEDLRSLIMQSPVPLSVLKGPELVYEMANAAYLEVVGDRDILGEPLLQALPEFRGQGFDEILLGVMRAGEPIVGREALFMLEREGRLQETYWTFICSPLRDTDGAVNRVVVLCEDVTEQRRLMNERIEADRRKDQFLATLAHELRNPLAPLRTSVDLLRRTDLTSPDLQRSIDVIDRQVQQLVRLVDDLLDVSRITLDKLELRKERVPLATVVQAAIEASRPLIEQWGHELTVVLPPEPVHLDADLTRLAQVFLNLLNNAAKYTERGGRIQLIAERQGDEIVVSVKDTGRGIAAELLPRVFDMFMQVDRSLDRSQGGLGIGLTLVKRLVQMHGGSIEARSDGPGKGSEFVVRLPAFPGADRGDAPVATPIGASPPDTPQTPICKPQFKRILVVDDNRDAAETLAELLSLAGHDLRIAHDGVAAVDVAGEFRPDVVLLDIGLPKMDGYAVARKLRAEPWGQGMMLVALTGWGQEKDRHRSREAGFDHHMIKPVEPDALLKLLTSRDAERCSAG